MWNHLNPFSSLPLGRKMSFILLPGWISYWSPQLSFSCIISFYLSVSIFLSVSRLNTHSNLAPPQAASAFSASLLSLAFELCLYHCSESPSKVPMSTSQCSNSSSLHIILNHPTISLAFLMLESSLKPLLSHILNPHALILYWPMLHCPLSYFNT